MQNLNIMILGGCFTEQHNINYAEHYHQLLRAKLISQNYDVHLNIVRYERLTKCLQKIILQTDIQQPDILIFHVRSEPLLRIAKFYYKFLDSTKKIKYAFNFSIFNKNNSELHRHFINRPNVFTTSFNDQRENAFYLFLLNFNYLFGALFGNWKYAYKLYLKLINDIQTFCIERQIPLIIVGPVSRPRNSIENLLSIKLNNYCEAIEFNSDVSYIKTLGIYNNKNENLFFENGMHVNQAGHKRISNLLFKVIVDKYVKFRNNTN